jgi:hypothetical protein
LRLRGPPEHAARAAFYIEDACRTELRDGERLVLIRRLALGAGAAAADQPGRAACLRRAFEQATRDSRHGGSDSAAAANCVWFASRAEARLLFLRELLAGRRPGGWYWALAVPEWRGRTLAQWLGLVLAEALAGTSGDDPAALVRLAVEAGAADLVVEALAQGAAAASPVTAPPATAPTATAPPAVLPVDRLPSRAAIAAPVARSVTIAHHKLMLVRLRAGLPPAIAAAIETVCRRMGSGSRAASLLLERLLVKASPSLALSPVLLGELTRAYADFLAGRDSGGEAPARVESVPPFRPALLSPVPTGRTAAAQTEPAVAAEVPRSAPAAGRPGEAVPPSAQAEAQPPGVASVTAAEARSPAAGLWLVLPALVRMGLLAGDPGRNLLWAIAAHHRVAPDDPALAPLEPGEPWTDPPLWARLWRTGLDRWLRRRARISLASLVWKPGWLWTIDDRLMVRFPLSAIDLRLRRRALDVDPGWTDWIGLSVRYAFADRRSS